VPDAVAGGAVRVGEEEKVKWDTLIQSSNVCRSMIQLVS